MKLFLAGWRPRGGIDAAHGRGALEATLASLPYFDPGAAQTWEAPSGRVTLSSVGHEPERVAGVSYLEADDRGFGLFSGRPILWTGDAAADGGAPLDPSFYRRPAAGWAEGLDGRCTALRYDDERGEFDLYLDPLGSYPVYAGERAGTRWVSNSAELVRATLDTREPDVSVIASLLRCGFSLEGRPLWARVQRLPRATLLRWREEGEGTATELLPLAGIPPSALRFDPVVAAGALVAATGALAAWPGRPVTLQLSGGRDSRLVYAAALRAGVEFQVVTAGHKDHPDVRVAREICELTGTSHRRLSPDPEGAIGTRLDEAALVLGLTSGGAFSLEDAAGYPLAQSRGPLPLWLGGQGGEISRHHYASRSSRGTASGAGAPELADAISARAFDSPRLLNDRGERLVRGQLHAAVERQLRAGVDGSWVPDLFYLLNRMSAWAAVGFGCVEYAKGDTISPLWSSAILPHQLRAGSQDAERFHSETLERLSPELAGLPYAEAAPSPAQSSAMDGVAGSVARSVQAGKSHPAWEVLDRCRVQQLLDRDPADLDARERRGLWRLATVFTTPGVGAQA